jgi:hypothetical protein
MSEKRRSVDFTVGIQVVQSLRGRSEIMNFLFTIVVIELCVTRYIQFFTFTPVLSS